MNLPCSEELRLESSCCDDLCWVFTNFTRCGRYITGFISALYFTIPPTLSTSKYIWVNSKNSSDLNLVKSSFRLSPFSSSSSSISFHYGEDVSNCHCIVLELLFFLLLRFIFFNSSLKNLFTRLEVFKKKVGVSFYFLFF